VARQRIYGAARRLVDERRAREPREAAAFDVVLALVEPEGSDPFAGGRRPAVRR